MTLPSYRRSLRVFLSSPGDVSEERQHARAVIDHLNNDPWMNRTVSLQVVAWELDSSGTPLLAQMTPQRAIDQGLPRPSQCDIVVIILRARMGTPLPYPEYKKTTGERFYSGTEWEYEDAIQTALLYDHPKVLLYRCSTTPSVSLSDPERAEKIQQWERLEGFFTRFKDIETGAILGGYNIYETPADFSKKFEDHMRVIIAQILATSSHSDSVSSDEEPMESNLQKSRYAFRQGYWSICYQLTREIVMSADYPAAVNCEVHLMRVVSLIRLGHLNAIKRSLDLLKGKGTPSQQARAFIEIAKHYCALPTRRHHHRVEMVFYLQKAIDAEPDGETAQEAEQLLKALP